MTLEERLQKAYQLSSENKDKDAISYFKDVLFEDPKNIKAYEGIMECFCRLEAFEQCIEWFKSAEEKNCLTALMHYFVGVAFAATKQLDLAEKHLMKDNSFTQRSIGEQFNTHMLLGFVRLASAKNANQENLAPNSIETKIKLAIDSYNWALKLSTSETDSDSLVDIHMGLGICFHSINNFEDAIKQFTQVIKIDNKHVQALIMCGICLANLGKYNYAIQSINEAINLTNDVQAYREKGLIYLKEKYYEQAIVCFEWIIALIPDDIQDPKYLKFKIQVYLYLTETWLRLKETEKAMDCSNAAINLDKNNAKIYYFKALALYRTSQLEKAIKTLVKALELIDKNSDKYHIDMRVLIYYSYAKIVYESAKDKQSVKEIISDTLNQAKNLIKNFQPKLPTHNKRLLLANTRLEEFIKFYENKYLSAHVYTHELYQISQEHHYKETKTHQAVREGNLTLLKTLKTLATSVNIDELNEDHETPLILAVKEGHFNCVQWLIQNNASINLSTLQANKDGSACYKNSLDIAFDEAMVNPSQSDRWQIVEYLLHNREKFVSKHFDDLIETFSSLYRYRENNNKEKYEHIRKFKLAASKLLNANLEYFLTQENIHKYLAHIMDREGEIREFDYKKMHVQSFPLGRWGVLEFFILRLYCYFFIYDKKLHSNAFLKALQKNKPTLNSDTKTNTDIYNNTRFLVALLCEILISLETLRCIRDGNLVEIVLSHPDIPANIKEKIKHAYFDNIINKILNLKAHENFVLHVMIPQRHSMYVNFSYDTEKGLIHRRIDNIGEGSHRHLKTKEGKIWPCELPPLTAAQLKKYLENIYQVRINPTRWFTFWNTGYEYIYDGPATKPNYYTPPLDPQSVVNCVAKNKNIGEQIRMGSHLYQILLEEERTFVQGLDRSMKELFEPLTLQDPELLFGLPPETMLSTDTIQGLHLPRARL